MRYYFGFRTIKRYLLSAIPIKICTDVTPDANVNGFRFASGIFIFLFYFGMQNSVKILSLKMGSRKSTLVKRRLAKAFRSNQPVPAWKRQTVSPRDGYNLKRRNWRSTKLKIY